MLAGVVRMSRRLCAVVTLDIVSELTEDRAFGKSQSFQPISAGRSKTSRLLMPV
jgi:hypothetical protein